MSTPRVRLVAAFVLVAAVAVLVYRPDIARPFHLWDFREFLPILDGTQGLWSGYGALLEYYAGHGRMNPLFYFTFALQYELFGHAAHGWQLLRFALMLLNVALLLGLGRRLGIGWLGCATAGLLLVVAQPVVPAWMQLMAEPMVLALLLVAGHAAVDFREAPRWRGRAAVILLAFLAALLTKEVAGVLGGVVIALALLGWARPVRLPAFGARRAQVLVAGAIGVVLVVGALILWVRSMPVATGYGMAYGSGAITLARALENIAAVLLLVRPGGATAMGLLYPANAIALILLALALASYLRRGGDRAALGRTLGLVAASVLLGALLYLPWPKFDAFYAMPFFVATALLIGAAADELGRGGGWRRGVAAVAVVVMVGYAAIPALRSRHAGAAMLDLNVAVVGILPALGPADTLVVLGPTEAGRQLPVRAGELRDYAVATGRASAATLPVVVDAPCDAPPPASERVAFLTYSFGCGVLPAPGLRLASGYRWRDWLTLRSRSDTLVADLVGPPVARLLPP